MHQVFHLPISQAAEKLGMGATAVKKICRRHGIARWPFRKLDSLVKIASAASAGALPACAEDGEAGGGSAGSIPLLEEIK